MTKPVFASWLGVLLLFAACDTTPRSQRLDTPTSGRITMAVDEVMQPLAEQLVDAFEARYPDAFLVTHFVSEKEAAQELINDSARVAILTRKLTAEEENYFAAQKYGIEQVMLASDAVVFIVNRANGDSVFTCEQLKRMLLGQDTLWSQLQPENKLGRILVVFDNGGSSNIRYLSDTLLGKKPLSASCFAVNSNQAVVDYVNANPGAIGVVGLNWIGDKDNQGDQERQKMICVAAVGDSLNSASLPHQSALALGNYPFRRQVWFVKIGKRPGLGTGFASFAYSETGQLIVQKAGLLPARPAERRIEMKIN